MSILDNMEDHIEQLRRFVWDARRKKPNFDDIDEAERVAHKLHGMLEDYGKVKEQIESNMILRNSGG